MRRGRPLIDSDLSASSIVQVREMGATRTKCGDVGALVLLIAPSGAATAPRWLGLAGLVELRDACASALDELQAYKAGL